MMHLLGFDVLLLPRHVRSVQLDMVLKQSNKERRTTTLIWKRRSS